MDVSGDCRVGVEKVESNGGYDDVDIRLGTVFMQNFYLALLYEENEILVGINKDQKEFASITVAEEPDP